MQSTTIDLLYHLPVLTATLLQSLYHILYSCQLSNILSSRLLSVLHYHHQNEQKNEQQQQYFQILIDLVLGKEHGDDNGDKDVDAIHTIDVNNSMIDRRNHLIQTSISFLSSSCTVSKEYVHSRVIQSLNALLSNNIKKNQTGTTVGCLLLIKTFIIDTDTSGIQMANVLEYAFELASCHKGRNNDFLFQTCLWYLRQNHTYISLTVEKLSSNVINIEQRLNAIHDIVRILEDEISIILRNDQKLLYTFLKNIESIKSMQTSYSGLAKRIWSQLVILDNTLRGGVQKK